MSTHSFRDGPVGRGGGGTHGMHDRSLMAIDARIPAVPAEHVEFSSTGQTLQALNFAKRRKEFDDSHEG